MPLIRPLHPGQIVGGYELIDSLAEGAIATTWSARSATGERVAIKIIPVASLDDPDMEDTFLELTEQARAVQHPTVARLLKAGRDGSLLYAAYEWVDGHGLKQFLAAASKRKDLPRPVALRLAWALCDTVAAVHACGQVHRGVAPGNVVITQNGTIKLLDLAVSAVLTKSSSSTTFRHMVGKFSYLSPEQLWSRPVDQRSDVFALGLVCYELLTGQHPFRGSHERETTASILSPTAAAPPAELGVKLDEALEAWLLKSLAKPADERFPDAAAMRDALQGALASQACASDAEVAALVREWLGGVSSPASAAPSGPVPTRIHTDPPPPLQVPTIEPAPATHLAWARWAGVILAFLAVGIALWAGLK